MSSPAHEEGKKKKKKERENIKSLFFVPIDRRKGGKMKRRGRKGETDL
jgi:hypothetical protein